MKSVRFEKGGVAFIGNRGIARERLAGRLRAALVPPRQRVATRPTKGSQTRRLDAKKQRGQTKSQRRRPSLPDD